MLTNIAVKYMLCIQKHQNESYMRHRRGIIGDSFKLQALVKASDELEFSQTYNSPIHATHPEALRQAQANQQSKEITFAE
jgi:hypothetical protein